MNSAMVETYPSDCDASGVAIDAISTFNCRWLALEVTMAIGDGRGRGWSRDHFKTTECLLLKEFVEIILNSAWKPESLHQC